MQGDHLIGDHPLLKVIISFSKFKIDQDANRVHQHEEDVVEVVVFSLPILLYSFYYPCKTSFRQGHTTNVVLSKSFFFKLIAEANI